MKSSFKLSPLTMFVILLAVILIGYLLNITWEHFQSRKCEGFEDLPTVNGYSLNNKRVYPLTDDIYFDQTSRNIIDKLPDTTSQIKVVRPNGHVEDVIFDREIENSRIFKIKTTENNKKILEDDTGKYVLEEQTFTSSVDAITAFKNNQNLKNIYMHMVLGEPSGPNENLIKTYYVVYTNKEVGTNSMIYPTFNEGTNDANTIYKTYTRVIDNGYDVVNESEFRRENYVYNSATHSIVFIPLNIEMNNPNNVGHTSIVFVLVLLKGDQNQSIDTKVFYFEGNEQPEYDELEISIDKELLKGNDNGVIHYSDNVNFNIGDRLTTIKAGYHRSIEHNTLEIQGKRSNASFHAVLCYDNNYDIVLHGAKTETETNTTGTSCTGTSCTGTSSTGTSSTGTSSTGTSSTGTSSTGTSSTGTSSTGTSSTETSTSYNKAITTTNLDSNSNFLREMIRFQALKNMFSTEKDYLLKTEVIPPVCPSCDSCPDYGLYENSENNEASETVKSLVRDAGSGLMNIARDTASSAKDVAYDATSGTYNAASDTVSGAASIGKDIIGTAYQAGSDVASGTIGVGREIAGGTVGLGRELVGGGGTGMFNGGNFGGYGGPTASMGGQQNSYGYQGQYRNSGCNYIPTTANFSAFSR